MKVHFEEKAGMHRMWFEGVRHADSAVSKMMHDTIAGFEPNEGCVVVVDFTGVEVICSGVIGMVLVLRTRVESKEGWIAVVATSDAIRELFNLTGLSRHIKICESLEQVRS